MDIAETSGRTINEAIDRALKDLGVSREDVDIEVLQEPRPALLGLGGRDARVRVRRRTTAGGLVREAVADVLGLMGYESTIEVDEHEERIGITLSGSDLGGLIGRHGQTLDAIELLVALRIARRLGRKVPIVLDAEGYRARRERALGEIARKAAERAVRERRAVFLEPMDARDRRIVHLALKDDPRVSTSSEGEEHERRVVVHPEPHSVAAAGRGLPEGLPLDEGEDSLDE